MCEGWIGHEDMSYMGPRSLSAKCIGKENSCYCCHIDQLFLPIVITFRLLDYHRSHYRPKPGKRHCVNTNNLGMIGAVLWL